MAAKYEGLANIGDFLGGLGSAFPGVGSLIGSLTGSSQQPDYASLYAQLAPGQAQITTQQYMLGAAMQPVTQAQGMLNQVYGQLAYDFARDAAKKDQTAAGMLAGIASESATAYNDVLKKSKLANVAIETLGLENAAKMANTYATAAANLQNQILTGEQGMLLPTATATAAAGQTAQQAKNQLAANIGSTNLDIRKQQENTRNAMALQRAQVEGQLALKRYGAGMALAGQAAFA